MSPSSWGARSSRSAPRATCCRCPSGGPRCVSVVSWPWMSPRPRVPSGSLGTFSSPDITPCSTATRTAWGWPRASDTWGHLGTPGDTWGHPGHLGLPSDSHPRDPQGHSGTSPDTWVTLGTACVPQVTPLGHPQNVPRHLGHPGDSLFSPK